MQCFRDNHTQGDLTGNRRPGVIRVPHRLVTNGEGGSILLHNPGEALLLKLGSSTYPVMQSVIALLNGPRLSKIYFIARKITTPPSLPPFPDRPPSRSRNFSVELIKAVVDGR